MQVKDVPARPNSHCLSDSTRMTMSLEGFHTGGDLNIEICGTTSSRLNEHINTRFQSALDRHDGRVGIVSVRLADLNGPKGGVDKHFRVTVQILDGGSVLVEETADDAYAAANRAADRIKQAVGREIDRRKERKLAG
jgi:putative sigma-54 modulation protein